ncbi:MAG: hypothetical protein A2Y33_07930 [Spirochaetes bacterium GWF1_51_8]|nr:MAG: hypothetical protein A2Y33_07930 [Spirochaetes bacterium GWF1_51_8]
MYFNFYDLIFYAIYRNQINLSKETILVDGDPIYARWLPKTEIAVTVAGIYYFLVVSVFKLYRLSKVFYQYYITIPLILIIFIFNIFYFNKSRVEKIIEYYDNLNDKRIKIFRYLLVLFALIVLILFIVAGAELAGYGTEIYESNNP